MSAINIEFLQSLKPFNDLPIDEIDDLLNQSHVKELLTGEQIFSNDCHDYFVFLHQGRVELCEQLHSAYFVKDDEPRALEALFVETASDVHVEAQSLCSVLFVEKNAVEKIINNEIFSVQNSNIELTHVELNIYNEILQAIESKKLELPSLPEIALRVKAAIAQDNVSADDVERIIEADPVMTVRLIQVANSALVRGREPVESIRDAIVRLGLSMTQNLVLSLSVKQLFKTQQPVLRRYMNTLYQHSIEISAMSFSLAERVKGMNGDQLLLAGLVHDIGVIPVLSYIEKTGFEIDEKNQQEVGRIIAKLRAAVGELVIKNWNFQTSMLDVVTYAEVWSHSASEKIDMIDIVNLAHIFSMLKNKQYKLMPNMQQVAAFQKMFPDQKTMELSNEVLELAKEKIAEVKRLLRL